jgi:hypothetical protein
MSMLVQRLEQVLGDFWERNAVPTAGEDGGSVEEMLVPLDSISACEVLIDIEELIKQQLPIGEIVQRGGYLKKEEFISRITEAVLEHMGGTS